LLLCLTLAFKVTPKNHGRFRRKRRSGYSWALVLARMEVGEGQKTARILQGKILVTTWMSHYP